MDPQTGSHCFKDIIDQSGCMGQTNPVCPPKVKR